MLEMATGVAEAYASAIVAASGSCEVSGQGSACALIDSSARSHATAHATALASAFADVDNGCDCTISSGAMASAFDSVFVEAWAEVDRLICTSRSAPPPLPDASLPCQLPCSILW